MSGWRCEIWERKGLQYQGGLEKRTDRLSGEAMSEESLVGLTFDNSPAAGQVGVLSAATGPAPTPRLD